MKDAHTLDRSCDPFSTLVGLTAAALTGRPFSPPSARFPSESEAARIPPRPSRRSLLERLDAFALKLAGQVASDVRPAASAATRAHELRVLRSYY
jgi:hypothetical protein